MVAPTLSVSTHMERFTPRINSGIFLFAWAALWTGWRTPLLADIPPMPAAPRITEESVLKNSRLLFSEYSSVLRQQLIWTVEDNDKNQRAVRMLTSAFPYVALSPDGKTVAYMSGKSVYLQDIQKPSLRRISLTPPSNTPLGDFSAGGLSFHGDGEKLVCALGQGGTSIIFAVDIKSEESKILFSEKAAIKFPVWSPDGERIAFSMWRKTERGDARGVYVMNANGSGQRHVATLTTLSPPAWSPDSTRLAIAAPSPEGQPNQPSEIFIASADGRGMTQITKDNAIDQFPVWLASGSIVYCSQREIGVLMAIQPDGSGALHILRRQDARNIQFLTASPIQGSGVETSEVIPPTQPAPLPVNPIPATPSPATPAPVTPPTTPAPVALPPTLVKAEIVFHSNRDGNDEIYVRYADDSIKRLTFDPANDGGAVPSAGGGKIAFTSNRDDNLEIYVMDEGGKNTKRLTANPESDIAGSWNPNDGFLAFYSNRNGNYDLYATNADGTALIQLTRDPADDIQPAYSPDGSKIAFASKRTGTYEIFVMNSNITNLMRLTRNQFTNREPAWSPDGKYIVWSCKEVRDEDIYIMNADGSNQKRLTFNSGRNVRPTFLNGDTIVFASDRDGNNGLYQMKIDGSGQSRLSPKGMTDLDPYAMPGAPQ